MKKIWWNVCLIVIVVQLVSIVFEISILQFISKPLILLSLLGYYVYSVTTRSALFIFALLFCWLGDVLLMFSGELFFILGLAAFLSGHVLYIFCYRQFRFNSSQQEVLRVQQIRYAFPILLSGTGLVVVLFPFLGSLKIPVMLYALVITTMAMQALFRQGYTSTKSFWLIFFGALLFMISDSALAINKFMHPLPFASLIIMATYMGAQCLIVEGAIEHQNYKSNQ